MGAIVSEVREWVSAYTINATPPGADQYNYLWEIKVEHAGQMDGSTKWAVRWQGRCLSRRGEWEYEPIPSSRSDGWLARHRFDHLESALRAARVAAPEVEINGRRAKDVSARL
jgi:hypothetical protein